MNVFLFDKDLATIFPKESSRFHDMMALHGTVYRALEGRSTERILLGEKNYFIKKHTGVGIKEILKNIIQGRWPVVSAKNEFLALRALHQWNILAPEVVAFGQKGRNPAERSSFIMTRELPKHVTLEDFCKHWQKCPPSFQFKLQLIKEVARLTRKMHDHGMNHRDFYLCHLLLDAESLMESKIKLYLIDLHRAIMHQYVPLRWRIKDVAGLYFSSKEIGLTSRDFLRFIIEYAGKPLRAELKDELTFWMKVKKRGDKLYRKHRHSITNYQS